MVIWTTHGTQRPFFYELYVKAFRDSNEDDMGDFKGLTEKLDYLSEIGVNYLGLLPTYPSPSRDDGYDIIEYGDEIGMVDNIYPGGRNGVGTPMQWNDRKNAGFSECSPSLLYAPVVSDPEFNYSAVNVELHQRIL